MLVQKLVSGCGLSGFAGEDSKVKRPDLFFFSFPFGFLLVELAKPLPSLIFLYQAFDGTIISIASFWGSDLPTFMYLSCSEMGSTYVYQAIQKVKGLGCYKQR